MIMLMHTFAVSYHSIDNIYCYCKYELPFSVFKEMSFSFERKMMNLRVIKRNTENVIFFHHVKSAKILT